MNIDNRIVLNPSLIAPNIVLEASLSSNTNVSHYGGQFESQGNISSRILQSTDQTSQIIHPPHHEANEDFSNVTDHTVLISRDDDVYSHSRYSPPPPYDLCQLSDTSVQPIPYPQQILHFPQHQTVSTVQYLHQQRLQYPQQESLQYHEEASDYPQPHRMPYVYHRDLNFPASNEPSPMKRHLCNGCLMVDTICFCFCILPICLLMYLIYFGAVNGF